MEISYQPRKRPRPEIKPSSHRVPLHQHRRTRSTNTTSGTNLATHIDSKETSIKSNAFADFKFFGCDTLEADAVEILTNDLPSPDLIYRESTKCSRFPSEQYADLVETSKMHSLEGFAIQNTPPPPPLPKYLETSRLRLGELTHPSGSPILERESLVDLRTYESLALDSRSELTVERSANAREVAGLDSSAHLDTTKEDLPTISNAVLADLEGSSVGRDVVRHSRIESGHPEPNDVTLNMENQHMNSLSPLSRRHSADQYSPQIQVYKGSHDLHIRRKSLPVSSAFTAETPSTRLELTGKRPKNPAEQGFKDRSINASSDELPEVAPSITENPKLQSPSVSVEPDISSYQNPLSRPDRKNSIQENKLRPSEAPTTEKPRTIQPKTPDTAERPTSPPLHRNAADNRKPLEQQDRETWTLYDLSCWTEKAYLRTLLKGPKFEFRVTEDDKPFLTNVSQEMLKHFCGEKHLSRLISEYSLQPEQDAMEDEEKNLMIFPERSVDATAIMRIIRYMRRCCTRTTAITKPHFQLHAPHSLEANIETIRACNIFGLYADARRLHYFLTDKKIPGGNITMEDVETIWEGYGGALRNSAYTDALLTHLVYNVLGSDTIDREDFMVLLEQEEFAGLRELVGIELGIKKRAAEDKEMFQIRKQLEREKKNHANGKDKRLSKMEKIRAVRGPMVQGRLLRVLSYDALLEPDLTAETRYKPRPGVGKRPVLSPALMDRVDMEEGLESVRKLYQDALMEVKKSEAVTAKRNASANAMSEVEREIRLPATRARQNEATSALCGRNHELDRPEARHVQKVNGSHPSVQPKGNRADVTGPKNAKSPVANRSSSQQDLTSEVKTSHSQARPTPPVNANRYSHPGYTNPSRDNEHVTSNATSSSSNNLGKRRPGLSIVSARQACTTSGSTPVLRSRTDPWWSTLGDSAHVTKKENPNRLMQLWDELRRFF